MSSGAFVNTFVKSIVDTTRIYSIRVQPESIAATVAAGAGPDVSNTPDAGPATESVRALVGGSTRRTGFHASVAYLTLTGTPPTGYAENSKTVIPILSATFLSTANRPNAQVTYLGTSWRVSGVRVEKSR